MKRILLAMTAVGLVGLLAGMASAQTPAVASLSVQTAAATVGHHPYYRPGPVYWRNHWAPRYYAPPAVTVVPPPMVVAPPPVYVEPVVPYYPYYYRPGATFYFGRPRFAVGVAF